MSKNANLRKQIKQILENDAIEIPKRKLYQSPSTAKIIPMEGRKHYDLRNLLNEDSKKKVNLLMSNPLTRDISHLQDKLIQPSLSLPILPTDLQVLKKLLTPELPSLQSPHNCKREPCLDSLLQLTKKTSEPNLVPESFERHILGNPTGRQDIKELSTWFHSMLETYKNSDFDNIRLIYEVCAKEITRQVSVNCLERGELLQILFAYQPDLYNRKVEIFKEEIKELHEKHTKENAEIQEKHKKNVERLEGKINEILQKVYEIKIEKQKVENELLEFKKKYREAVRRFSAEEKIWNQKYYGLFQKLRSRHAVINNQNHPLSVFNRRVMNENEKNKDLQNNERNGEDEFLNNKAMIEIDSDFSKYVLTHNNYFQEMEKKLEKIDQIFEDYEQNIEEGGKKENIDDDKNDVVKQDGKSDKNEENENIKGGEKVTIIEIQSEDVKNLSSDEKNSQNRPEILEIGKNLGLNILISDEDSQKNFSDQPFKDHSIPLINVYQINSEEPHFTENDIPTIKIQTDPAIESNTNRGENYIEKRQFFDENRHISNIYGENLHTLNLNFGDQDFSHNQVKAESFIQSGPIDRLFDKSEGQPYIAEYSINLHNYNADESYLKDLKLNEKSQINRKTPDLVINFIETISIQPKFTRPFSTISLEHESLDPEENFDQNNDSKKNEKQVINTVLDLVSPKSSANTKKARKKILPKFLGLNRGLKESADSKALASPREQELQQTIESLRNDLKKKDEIIFENIKQLNSSKMKAGIVNFALSRSLTSNISPDPTKERSPRNSAYAIQSRESLRGIEIETIDESLIADHCDIFSWKTGYAIGYDKGRKDGLKEGEILGIEEKEFERIYDEKLNNSDSDDSRIYVKRESLRKNSLLLKNFTLASSNGKRSAKELTKIIQFHFSRPNLNQPKKQHPVTALVQKFFSRNKEFILSKCTLSRKIVNKMISSTYLSCLSKLKNGDSIDSLIEQVYDDFYQKYGLKAVSEKRFTEFIASLLNYASYRRVIVFLKFLSCASKLDQKNYSNLSFIYYLNSLQYMLTTKIGVIVSYEEIADFQMFPTLRGIECIKEKIEWITDKNTLSNIISEIQSKSQIDNRGINPGGIVELELVLENITEVYENYQKNIENGLVTLITALGIEDSINNYELLMIFRHISHERIDFSDDESKSDPKKINFFQLVKELESKENFNLEEVTKKCIENNLLKISDVKNFYCTENEIKAEEVLLEISNNKIYYESVANEIGNNGKKLRTIDGSVFIEKINELVEQVNEKEPYLTLLAWKIYQAELQRVKSNIFTLI